MQTLGGMLKTVNGLLYFPCGDAHEAACRRVFLEACKLPPNAEPDAYPLKIRDKKSGLYINVGSAGRGIYRVTSEGEGEGAARRVMVIAKGLMKLGEMVGPEPTRGDTVAFACSHAHDALVGLLLIRAPNVRVVLRQEEEGAVRGILTAPSQQT